MAVMNVPNPARTGRIGRQVLCQTSKIEPERGKDYIIDWMGTRYGGITGELMACTYLASTETEHFFSYLATSTWGGVTVILNISDEALLRGEVTVYEMIETE